MKILEGIQYCDSFAIEFKVHRLKLLSVLCKFVIRKIHSLKWIFSYEKMKLNLESYDKNL